MCEVNLHNIERADSNWYALMYGIRQFTFATSAKLIGVLVRMDQETPFSDWAQHSELDVW